MNTELPLSIEDDDGAHEGRHYDPQDRDEIATTGERPGPSLIDHADT